MNITIIILPLYSNIPIIVTISTNIFFAVRDRDCRGGELWRGTRSCRSGSEWRFTSASVIRNDVENTAGNHRKSIARDSRNQKIPRALLTIQVLSKWWVFFCREKWHWIDSKGWHWMDSVRASKGWHWSTTKDVLIWHPNLQAKCVCCILRVSRWCWR